MKAKTLLSLILPIVVVAIAIWLWFKPPASSWYNKEINCRADLIGIATQLDMFRREQGRYPSDDEGLDVLIKPARDLNALPHWHQYLPGLPLDPWRRSYRYKFPGVRHANGFDLYSLGPDGVPSVDDIYPPEESAGHR